MPFSYFTHRNVKLRETLLNPQIKTESLTTYGHESQLCVGDTNRKFWNELVMLFACLHVEICVKCLLSD